MNYKEMNEKAPKLAEVKSLPNWESVLNQARIIWNTKSEETWKKDGDLGCCIIGEGLELYCKPPRCRKGQYIHIMNSPSRWQGEHPRLAGMKDAKAFIISKYPELEPFISCNHGRMD